MLTTVRPGGFQPDNGGVLTSAAYISIFDRHRTRCEYTGAGILKRNGLVEIICITRALKDGHAGRFRAPLLYPGNTFDGIPTVRNPELK